MPKREWVDGKGAKADDGRAYYCTSGPWTIARYRVASEWQFMLYHGKKLKGKFPSSKEAAAEAV